MKNFTFTILLFTIMLPFPVKAKSTIAYEMNSDKVLYSENIHDKRSVASISKIMTAIIACESNKLDDIVTMGEEINKGYGSGIYISIGEKMSLRDLVYGLMLRSGNDASYAIAVYLGGNIDNFVTKMNTKAKEIGMLDSIFNNPNGLDEKGGNISTAYDMALLTTYAMKNNEYKKITGTKKYTVKTNMNYYSWINKNKLLFTYQYVTGGKTGYTDIAKRTLVTTASKDNVDVVIVTLNDSNDFNDHKYLYDDIFKEYKGYYILKKGDISIFNSENKDKFYVKNDFKYPLNELEKDSIRVKFNLNREEYKNDDKIGKVIVYQNDKEIYNDDVFVKVQEKVTLWQKIKSFFGND